MNHQKRFELNLHLAALKYPDWNDVLSKADVSAFARCVTQKGEENLKDKKGLHLYAPEGAWKETEHFWKNLDLSSIEVLYVYGVGLGYLFAFVEEWLGANTNRHVVFIEDDQRMLARWMETERATKMLLHDQVKIALLDFRESGFELSMKTIDHLVSYFNFLKYKIIAIPYYERTKQREFATLVQALPMAYSNHLLYLSEYMDLSKTVFRNMYLNYLNIEDACQLKDLQGAFKKIPAIICGAGSSFEKNIAQLKNLGPKSVLFAGGAALSFLNHHHLMPHFGAVIDPNPPFERFFLLSTFETPYFYQTRVSHPVISLVHGKRILVQDIGGCPIEDWLKMQLKIPPEHFDQHYTVSDFCTSLACHMGCDPIIFLGMDLSFTEEKYYASGVEKSDDRTVEKESLLAMQDIFGQTVYTKNDWVLCSKKIASIAQDNPRTAFINATEGGIGFEGIPNLSFHEAQLKYLTHSYDVEGSVHQAIVGARSLTNPKSEVLVHLKKMRDSLEQCQKICKHLNMKLAAAYENWLGKAEQELNPENEEFCAVEKILKEEVAYQEILAFFWKVIGSFSERLMQKKERGKDSKGAPLRRKMNEIGFYIYACEEHKKIIEDVLKISQ